MVRGFPENNSPIVERGFPDNISSSLEKDFPDNIPQPLEHTPKIICLNKLYYPKLDSKVPSKLDSPTLDTNSPRHYPLFPTNVCYNIIPPQYRWDLPNSFSLSNTPSISPVRPKRFSPSRRIRPKKRRHSNKKKTKKKKKKIKRQSSKRKSKKSKGYSKKCEK